MDHEQVYLPQIWQDDFFVPALPVLLLCTLVPPWGVQPIIILNTPIQKTSKTKQNENILLDYQESQVMFGGQKFRCTAP